MLIGIVSDIHCNEPAFRRAITALGDRAEVTVVAGDAILQYRFSNEVIGLIREHHMAYVLGNHELAFLSPGGARARAAEWICSDHLEFMAAAPTRLQLDVDGKRILVVHASPFPPYDEYLYRGNPRLRDCADLDADVLIIGHTHRAMAERIGSTLVVNPGSLGQPDDPDHPGLVSYALLDTDSEEVTVSRFDAATGVTG